MVSSRPKPSLSRRLLPCAVFLAAFTVVMVLLVMSMDMKALRNRRSFNLTQDLDFLSVAQDNPQFIAYIQAVHLRPPFLFTGPTDTANVGANPPPHTKLVAKLLHFKKKGMFVETGAYRYGRPSDTEWLEQTLGWRGLLIQPDPMDFLVLRRHNRTRSHTIHACLSPTPYPKEVTFRDINMETSMKVNNITGDRHDSLFTRVKCFPLYSILLAGTNLTVDYLSLDAEGAEMQVLKTLPFDLIHVTVISVRWKSNQDERTQKLLQLMAEHNYKLERVLGSYYIFCHLNIEI